MDSPLLTVSAWAAALAVLSWPYGDRLDVLVAQSGIYLRVVLIPWEDIHSVREDVTGVWLQTSKRYWNTWSGTTVITRYAWNIPPGTASRIEETRERFTAEQVSPSAEARPQ